MCSIYAYCVVLGVYLSNSNKFDIFVLGAVVGVVGDAALVEFTVTFFRCFFVFTLLPFFVVVVIVAIAVRYLLLDGL